MRFCFGLAALLLVATCGLEAAGVPEEIRKLSLVRADPRTGRLVRKAAVQGPPRPIRSRASDGIPAVVEEAARRHDVDPLLVHSVIEVESAYNPYAISPKGAEGLMQLIPSTARRFGVRNSFDPSQNLAGGVKYLKHLMGLFDNNLTLALAAYNAGEAAVARYNNTIPPYPETRDYVSRVEKKLGEAQQAAARKVAAAPKNQAERAPEHSPIEELMGADGRIYYRTR